MTLAAVSLQPCHATGVGAGKKLVARRIADKPCDFAAYLRANHAISRIISRETPDEIHPAAGACALVLLSACSAVQAPPPVAPPAPDFNAMQNSLFQETKRLAIWLAMAAAGLKPLTS